MSGLSCTRPHRVQHNLGGQISWIPTWLGGYTGDAVTAAQILITVCLPNVPDTV